MRDTVYVPQVVTAECIICLKPEPWCGMFTGNTERDLIAALCNHVMQVHHGGSVDAWAQAKLQFPKECREWEQEVKRESEERR